MTVQGVSASRRPVLGRVVALCRTSPAFVGGVGLALVMLIAAACAPLIAPHDPLAVFSDAVRQPPDLRFPMGVDGNGMDILSRVIYGARYAFLIAVPSVVIGVVLGAPLGLVAGYYGGAFDEVALRCLDVLRSFPTIILAMAIVAATGSSVGNMILVIGVVDAPIFARLIRVETLSLRSGGLVRAAVAAGNPDWRTMLVHVAPNALRGVLAQIAVRLSWSVRIAAALAFVGIGIQAPTPEWGSMIRHGSEFVISGEWWIAVFPGLALMLFVLAFSWLGDGAQELLDPRRPGRV